MCSGLLMSLLSLGIFSCEDPEEKVTTESPCITILVGDKDGFGMGLAAGSPLIMPAGTALPLDSRSSGDPLFTDIYPADLGDAQWPSHQIIYDVEFEKPVKTIVSARIKALTLGIQDGDNQVSGSDTDLKLYLDDVELPNAFDELDQFNMVDESWTDIAGTIEIEIPEQLLPTLLEGKIVVRLEILQLNPSQSFDAFAIDYCELEICYGSELPF